MSEIYGESLAELSIDEIEQHLALGRWEISTIDFGGKSATRHKVTITASDSELAITKRGETLTKTLRLCFEAACDLGLIRV